MLPLDPHDHEWFTRDGDLIASRLTEYDALRVAQKCADKFRHVYVVRGPAFETVVEPGHRLSVPLSSSAVSGKELRVS